jgi:L-seryl-tRNA(Ser) seleniumtransferase|uniref:L-seryl-tRNA(Sec) selenium transferase n=1 Tax=Desulfobacca acetoxidans TaxID=60893 RepID=A0A7C5AN36_9BACT
MEPRRAHLLRQIPAVDELLHHPQLQSHFQGLSRSRAAEVVREVLGHWRRRLLTMAPEQLPGALDPSLLLEDISQALAAVTRFSLTRVINATGVIIHTNLGRSPLAAAAQKQILTAAAFYTNLEYNLDLGKRGSRQSHLEGLAAEITGAEAALVVNNNAAGVFLALTALTFGREVIISRGQLVEIGGSFRMPDIMALSGAVLKEVGTTNKTYLADYERAITSQTAMLLKVHPSNFRLMGFTQEVPLADLVALGRRYGLLVMEDLGSGCLVDLSRFGLEKEPTVQEAVATGADLVLFSGDKLLGGPQAGIILGKAEVVQRLRQHPLTRALRPDKLTIAGLEATLRLYLKEDEALRQIPALRMLTMPLSEVDRQARRLARSISRRWPGRFRVRVTPSVARSGGGALPMVPIPSRALILELPPLASHQLEERLRRAHPPVIARLEQDCLLLDVRTLLPEDYPRLFQVLGELAAASENNNQNFH